ncbi:hypothetical protein LCGC14_2894750, partial [marine sediment metagenome]
MRDYGVDGQLGLEKTFEEYIDKLCGIYDEVKRVLRKDGTCWVNLGDTYNGSGGDHKPEHKNDASFQSGIMRGSRPTNTARVPKKSLCLIPQRFAIEMVNRGWILRNVIIWAKPNPMPSSAKDRFTVDFEYVYFFVKQKKYFFEPQYEPYLTESNAERPRMGQGQNTRYAQKRGEHKNLQEKGQQTHTMHINRAAGKGEVRPDALGRNKRTVWTIPTQSFSEAHFATFPEKLVEPMILSGCAKEVCTKCGQGRRKVYEYHKSYQAKNVQGKSQLEGLEAGKRFADRYNNEPTFKGYSDCGCGVKFRPGIVIDIFAGSGTTLKVAARNGRN